MHQDLKIEIIRSATGCSKSEAELAYEAADGAEEKAIGLVSLIRPRYLAAKVHFSASGIRSLEGLALLVMEDGKDAPIYVSDVVVHYSEEPIHADTEATIVFWQQLIASHRRQQNRYNIESSLEFKEYIETEVLPETGYALWNAARDIKELKASDSNEKEKAISENENFAKTSVKQFFESYFKLKLKIELGIEFQTEGQFVETAKSLGISSQSGDDLIDDIFNENPMNGEASSEVSIVLKGQVVIDATNGILSSDLNLGDRIAVDITERTPASERLSRLLGLRRNGLWLHTWGSIVKSERMESGNLYLLVEIARNIFVETHVMNTVRIKSERQYPQGKRSEYVLESPSVIPGYLIIAGISLFFSLLVKILMVVANN